VVVDVSNSPSWEDAAVLNFFETSTRNLLAHEAAARVGHHIALSVVGSERMLESGYFRATIAQENLVKASSIPYSIVRATQFFEFVKGIADLSAQGNTVRLPHVLFQPIAADDIATALSQVALGRPINGMVEIGGPERSHLDDIVRKGLAAWKDPRVVVADPHARGPYSQTAGCPCWRRMTFNTAPGLFGVAAPRCDKKPWREASASSAPQHVSSPEPEPNSEPVSRESPAISFRFWVADQPRVYTVRPPSILRCGGTD
jgi:hypothetical protein